MPRKRKVETECTRAHTHSHTHTHSQTDTLRGAVTDDAAAEAMMNQKALAILDRVELKLTGNDFSSALSPSADSYERFLKATGGLEACPWRVSRKGILVRPGALPPSFPRGVSVQEQVEFLIRDASDPQNLCQAFFGWYPFW